MKIYDLNTYQRILFFGTIFLIAASLTITSLFRLPLIYEQTVQERTTIFIIFGLIILALILIASLFFILPIISLFINKNAILFIVILSLILSIAFVLSSAHYWAAPEIHKLDICFTGDAESTSLNIQKLVNPNTNRLFPPDSFGFSRYPITVESGQCIHGRVIFLISPLTQALIGYQITATIGESPPDGRLLVSVNETPSVIYFDQAANNQNPEIVVLRDGFSQGIMLRNPYKQYWFIGMKLIAIIISSIFIALLLFSLTEEIFSFSNQNTNKSSGDFNA